jgi:hypothetical protein
LCWFKVWLVWGLWELQVPPLRYAPVGMTLLFAV